MVDQVNDARRSRRAILSTAVAAAAAGIVGAVARPIRVLAAASDDNVPVVTGGLYDDVSMTTLLQNQTINTPVLKVVSTVGGTALWAKSGSGLAVLAESASGYGVQASSGDASAIVAGSKRAEGLSAESAAEARPAIFGAARGGSTAVQGHAGNGSPAPQASTGVMGSADGSGTGGYFSSPSGNALRVQGKASFSRAGRTSIPKNRAYVDIAVAGGLASTASVVATLQVRRGTCAVTAVRVNYPTAGKARIYLNKVASTTASTPVGWFVIG